MLVEGFDGSPPAENLAGSTVQGVSDGLELLGVPAGQVGALREVLAQQAVGVLVRAALPGAVRISEEHREAGLDRELGVLRQLLAAVPGDGPAELFRQDPDGNGERVLHRDRAVAAQCGAILDWLHRAEAVLAWQVDEQRETG